MDQRTGRLSGLEGRLTLARNRRSGRGAGEQRAALCEPLESRLLLDSTVVFNEVMYHPRAGSTTPEWVELYNQMSVNMDVSGWTVAGGVDYRFPSGTIIPAMGYVVVSADPVAMAATGFASALGPFTGKLDNAGEAIKLLDNSGRMMDELDYGVDGVWSVGPDGSGATLAKSNAQTGTAAAGNWKTSAQMGGTPGAANFPAAAAGDRVAITSLFSTGLDGSGHVLPAGQADPHWTNTGMGGTAVATNNHPAWVANDNGSQWVSIVADGQTNIPPGQYSFTTHFDLTGFDASTAVLQFSVAVDNALDDVLVNGVSTGINYSAFAAFSGVFTIDRGLVAGNNTLEFRWTNFNEGANPGGLRVNIGGMVANPVTAVTPPPKLAFNEVAAAGGGFFVELQNDGVTPADLTGIRIVDGTGGAFSFGSQSLGAGQQLSVSAGSLGFAVAKGDALFIETADGSSVLDGVRIGDRLIGRSPQRGNAWQYSSAATPGVANVFNLTDDVVISEIMYHHSLIRGATFVDSPEEWIELYNRGTSAVDLSGWALTSAVSYTFAPGTVLAPGAFVVIAHDAADMHARYPAITVRGNFSGTLSNSDDDIVLVDAAQNIADEVHYYDGGEWPAAADGGGSSLELKDPFADNSKPEAWKASDESSKSQWQTITYRGVASEPAGSNFPNLYNELALGLLDSGSVLIDDVSLIENPGSAPRQLIQNGNFEDGTANKWRFMGSHTGAVVLDLDDPANHVLELVATSATDYLSNNMQTTAKAGGQFVTISDGTEYEISLRVKWLSGSPQFNSRLFFDRLAQTTILTMPADNGTPGAASWGGFANVGPTYEGLSQGTASGAAVVSPGVGQAVMISVSASDPQGVAAMVLKYAVNGGGFVSVPMTVAADGRYAGTIPGQASGAVVQFYVEGTDTLGAVSDYPAAGTGSRAMYKVGLGLASGSLHQFTIIMDPNDAIAINQPTNLMSDGTYGATVIYDDRIYYDVGVHLKGSEHGRASLARRGYTVEFHPDDLFRGVQSSVAFDRSGNWNLGSGGFGQDEILAYQILNHAGNLPSLVNDLVYLDAPGIAPGTSILQMSKYGDVWAEDQFGQSAQLYTYEVIYWPELSNPSDPESPKMAQEGGYSPVSIRPIAGDKEAYRYNYIIENNVAQDNYDPIMALTQAFGLSGAAFLQQAPQVIDVDEWLRYFAAETLIGPNDHYSTSTLNHNLRLMVDPTDGKMLALPWDMDFGFSPGLINAPLSQNADLNNLLQSPANVHMFQGHVQDILATTFNSAYLNDWVTYYQSLLPGQNLAPDASYFAQRAASAQSQLIGQVPYQITTNAGANFTVPGNTVTLQGTGWINVREIHLNGQIAALTVTWLDPTTWQVTVPVGTGANTITLQAFDFEGQAVATDSIVVTSTLGLPVVVPATAANLAITELDYNPTAAVAALGEVSPNGTAQDFEFLEVKNTGTDTVDLTGVHFTKGITFDFTTGSQTTLAPGARMVIVKNIAAFQSRYPGFQVDGVYGGSLDNSGEQVTLVDATGAVINNFTYNNKNGWPTRADGKGSSLEVVNTAGNYNDAANWRDSAEYGGSPGATGAGSLNGVVVNEVLTHTDPPLSDSVELFNPTNAAIDLSGWFLSDALGTLTKYRIPNGTVLGAGQYIVFTEADFNSTLGASPNDFSFNGAMGDDVWLTKADAATGKLLAFADHVSFGAAINGESFGRVPNGSGELYPQISRTLGAPNSGPRVGPVVISEVMYNPPGSDTDTTQDQFEFVELYNPTSAAVDLSNWSLVNGITLVFASGTTIAAQGTLVVVPFSLTLPADAARLAAFRLRYGIDASVKLVGPYTGKLSNDGEQIELRRPDTPEPENPTFFPQLLEDQVNYDDALPWTTGPDGGGTSLTRLGPGLFGDDPANWSAATPTPGSVPFDVTPPVISITSPSASEFISGNAPTFSGTASRAIGDSVNVTLKVYAGLTATGSPVLTLNATADATSGAFSLLASTLPQGRYTVQASQSDSAGNIGLSAPISYFTYDTLAGDANGDSTVTFTDFLILSNNFGLSAAAGPSLGDFNFDGTVNFADFVILSNNFGLSYVAPPHVMAQAATALVDPVVEEAAAVSVSQPVEKSAKVVDEPLVSGPVVVVIDPVLNAPPAVLAGTELASQNSRTNSQPIFLWAFSAEVPGSPSPKTTAFSKLYPGKAGTLARNVTAAAHAAPYEAHSPKRALPPPVVSCDWASDLQYDELFGTDYWVDGVNIRHGRRFPMGRTYHGAPPR